jgi:hypothetical protein
VSHIIQLVRNIVEDVSVTYFITEKIFCQCCGMQLRTTPAEREYKEKVNRKNYSSTYNPTSLISGNILLQ